MRKVMFALFNMFEWLHRHKRTSFLIGWAFYALIFIMANRTIYEWQFWVIFILLITSMTRAYIEGRLDEEANI